MVKRRLMFTYPSELIREPIIFNLGEQFNIVTNIHLADISEDRGWVVLELEGEETNINSGIETLKQQGIDVELVEGDILEIGAATGYNAAILQNVVGKRVSEIIPGIRESDPELFDGLWQEVALRSYYHHGARYMGSVMRSLFSTSWLRAAPFEHREPRLIT